MKLQMEITEVLQIKWESTNNNRKRKDSKNKKQSLYGKWKYRDKRRKRDNYALNRLTNRSKKTDRQENRRDWEIRRTHNIS